MSDEANPDDTKAIALIHTEDARPWANFFQRKLQDDKYNIPCSLHLPIPFPPFFSPTSPSPYRLCAVLISPEFFEKSFSQFWTLFPERCRGPTLLVMLGVLETDMEMVLGANACSRVLKHPRALVDGSQDSVTQALVKMIEMYEASEPLLCLRTPCQETCQNDDKEEGGKKAEEEEEEKEEEENEGDREEESKKDRKEEEKGKGDDKMGEEGKRCVTMKESKYGDEEGIYDYPPPPRQQNSIVRVEPSVLYEVSEHILPTIVPVGCCCLSAVFNYYSKTQRRRYHFLAARRRF